MVAGAMRASQMPWSGSCQRRATAWHMARDQAPVGVLEVTTPVGQGHDQLDDGAEHIELDLLVGQVADADRPRACVPGQRVDDGLGAERAAIEGVDRMQPLGPGQAASTACTQSRNAAASAVEPSETSACAVIAASRSQQCR